MGSLSVQTADPIPDIPIHRIKDDKVQNLVVLKFRLLLPNCWLLLTNKKIIIWQLKKLNRTLLPK
ncbi:MAG: hypothetical protein RL308_3471 [Bacteroidota bacterium]|jgi:hypothetical protein